MRKSFGSFVALAVCLTLVPAAGAATLQVRLELPPAVVPTNAEQTVFFDAFVVDLDNTSERLVAFNLQLNATNFSPEGVRFGPSVNSRFPEPANHPYVFEGIPTGVAEDFASTYNVIRVGAGPSETDVDVTPNRNGLMRIPIIIPANPVPGLYLVSVDPRFTQFAGNAGPITTVVEPGVAVLPVLPEPAGAALLGGASALLLRRRRGARHVAN
jgi:hypothetical protein